MRALLTWKPRAYLSLLSVLGAIIAWVGYNGEFPIVSAFVGGLFFGGNSPFFQLLRPRQFNPV